MEGHLDPELARAFQSGDLGEALEFLERAARELQGEYVLDLGELREVGEKIMPLLEAHPETRPFGSWLRAHTAYFEVADRLREKVAAPPRTAPGPPVQLPVQPPQVPTPSQLRRAWTAEVAERPAPPAAAQWTRKLKPIFRNAGTPPELVWLAEIESAFDPNAQSPMGAAGLFQLMPATAVDLGLRLRPKDERYVPEKNAKAAAAYLARLRHEFSSWALTLAAYNAGPGRVIDLLRRRRAASFDAISPSLPAETQGYIPRIENILKKREGVTLASLSLSVPK